MNIALEHEEPKIVDIETLYRLNIKIPAYQRPYKWTIKQVNQLFNDIHEANEKNLSEYRIGTIVIHKDDYGNYNIVDGQQRVISLKLLMMIINNDSFSPKNNKSNIYTNYYELKRLWSALEESKKGSFKLYLLQRCKVIRIIINKQSEAFQYFDSQNSRGKALEIHDLLKAYHLREMHDVSEQTKYEWVEKWEAIESQELVSLFTNYLYRIKKWCVNEKAYQFKIEGIEIFKGISSTNQYNFMLYHKSAHLFIEKFNKERFHELLGGNELIQFQLDQPLLSGTRFFKYVIHYIKLKQKICKIAAENIPDYFNEDLLKKGAGLRYVKELYECLLLYFYDRYGINNRNKIIEKKFMQYAIHLRLIHHTVYEKTMNKYALGYSDKLNTGLNLFTLIANSNHPREIEMIQLEPLISSNIHSRYREEIEKDNSLLAAQLGGIVKNEN